MLDTEGAFLLWVYGQSLATGILILGLILTYVHSKSGIDDRSLVKWSRRRWPFKCKGQQQLFQRKRTMSQLVRSGHVVVASSSSLSSSSHIECEEGNHTAKLKLKTLVQIQINIIGTLRKHRKDRVPYEANDMHKPPLTAVSSCSL